MLCKEFGWTPAELDAIPAHEVDDFKLILRYRHQMEEREQAKANRGR